MKELAAIDNFEDYEPQAKGPREVCSEIRFNESGDLPPLTIENALGDRPTNRYYLFSIEVELGKKLEYADYGRFRKRCEMVYVEEVDGLERPNKTVLELIKTSGG